MTTLIVNYTELRFTSEVEMTRYLSQTEEIWNEKVMAMLLESGLQRKTVTQIWNQSDQFKLQDMPTHHCRGNPAACPTFRYGRKVIPRRACP